MTPPQSSNIALPKLASWFTNDGWSSRAGSNPGMRSYMYQQNEPIDANVVVVPHVAVGDDVETRFLLVSDHGRDRVGVGLFVLHFLESDPYIAAAAVGA